MLRVRFSVRPPLFLIFIFFSPFGNRTLRGIVFFFFLFLFLVSFCLALSSKMLQRNQKLQAVRSQFSHGKVTAELIGLFLFFKLLMLLMLPRRKKFFLSSLSPSPLSLLFSLPSSGHRSFVHCVAWNIDGTRLASGSKDGGGLVWYPDRLSVCFFCFVFSFFSFSFFFCLFFSFSFFSFPFFPPHFPSSRNQMLNFLGTGKGKRERGKREEEREKKGKRKEKEKKKGKRKEKEKRKEEEGKGGSLTNAIVITETTLISFAGTLSNVCFLLPSFLPLFPFFSSLFFSQVIYPFLFFPLSLFSPTTNI